MVVAFAFATLAMDFGRVQLAKTEMHTRVDCAAKYGVKWVAAGAGVVYTKCNELAAENLVNGQQVSLSATDVEVGNWNYSTRTFTANARPRNAVKVHGSATVPLALGGPVHVDSCNVGATAVVACVPMGITGLNGIAFKNNTFIGSYNSAVNTHPTPGNNNSNAVLVSNGPIGDKNNGTIEGDAFYGPSGSADLTFSAGGAPQQFSAPIPTPADPAWNPSANPNGSTNGNYTFNINGIQPGGTYWYTGLTVSRSLTFSGPTTIYVNGDINVNADLKGYNDIPSNLTIYQLGTNRQFNCGAVDVIARIIAPGSDFVNNNTVKFYGACLFNTITTKNNCQFFFDEQIAGAAAISMVK
jgi:hypothetical protein